MNVPSEMTPPPVPPAGDPEHLEASASFDADVMAYIRRATQCGLYDIRGINMEEHFRSFHQSASGHNPLRNIVSVGPEGKGD